MYKRFSRRLAGAAVATGLVMALVACSGAEPSENQAGDVVLRVGAIQEPVNMSPAKLALGNDRMMAMMVYSGLVRYKMPTTEIVSDVATEWNVSTDGLTYTFKLRQGVKFHKGYGELTSADVKFTVDYHKSPNNASVVRTLYEPVETVETPDPYTAIFKLSRPVNGFLNTLAWQNGYILSSAAVTKLGPAIGTEPVGSGPFELTEWRKGENLTFSRFADYFGDKPQASAVKINIIPSELTQILAVSKGDLDVASITTLPALETANSLDTVQVKTQPSQWVNIAHLNCRPENVTGDVRVRQALMHAIDVNALTSASKGFQQPQVTFLNPYIFGYSDKVPKYPFDQNRAKQLLAEAGYDGRQVSIVYASTFQFEDLAQILKQSFEAVGVKAVLEKTEGAVYSQRGVQGKFDLWISAAARNTADEYLSPYFTPSGPRDYGRCGNEKLGTQIAAARSDTNQDSAKASYETIQQAIMQDVLIMPISLQQGAWALSPKISSFEFDAYPFLADFQRTRLGG